MLQFLFDTDHLTLFGHRQPQVMQRYAAQPLDTMGLCPVSMEEILRGRLTPLAKATSGPRRVQAFAFLGAYCPDDHEYVDRRYTDKNLNAQSLIELFTLLMTRHPETKVFRIYLDKARYHHALVLKEWIAAVQQERGVLFDLKYLPPYSPNLNLIERLWKFLRKEALQKWHATFEDMQQAVAEVLDHLDRYEESLASLRTERFHRSPRIETVVVGGWAKRPSSARQ